MHRDISINNIMFTPGELGSRKGLLIDFDYAAMITTLLKEIPERTVSLITPCPSSLQSFT